MSNIPTTPLSENSSISQYTLPEEASSTSAELPPSYPGNPTDPKLPRYTGTSAPPAYYPPPSASSVVIEDAWPERTVPPVKKPYQFRTHKFTLLVLVFLAGIGAIVAFVKPWIVLTYQETWTTPRADRGTVTIQLLLGPLNQLTQCTTHHNVSTTSCIEGTWWDIIHTNKSFNPGNALVGNFAQQVLDESVFSWYFGVLPFMALAFVVSLLHVGFREDTGHKWRCCCFGSGCYVGRSGSRCIVLLLLVSAACQSYYLQLYYNPANWFYDMSLLSYSWSLGGFFAIYTVAVTYAALLWAWFGRLLYELKRTGRQLEEAVSLEEALAYRRGERGI
ncbi:hypothetical protein HK097_003396 [Rhizophlyctis rosea]|uniref:Uncharacterized protein n=1 Tax=Rhizophlyctis rosea TaxID=64517 RepID=A0AAD5SKR0_9FUNG|nr:hypothetical protein HK097_003396 [Rhizophlyctis rosea]